MFETAFPLPRLVLTHACALLVAACAGVEPGDKPSGAEQRIEQGSLDARPSAGTDEEQARQVVAVLAQADRDGDGKTDLNELQAGTDPESKANAADVDGDGLANGVDPDVDGDGLRNAYDIDIDGDGRLNSFDTDADADGLHHYRDHDDDGDGSPDLLDNDDDGDLLADCVKKPQTADDRERCAGGSSDDEDNDDHDDDDETLEEIEEDLDRANASSSPEDDEQSQVVDEIIATTLQRDASEQLEQLATEGEARRGTLQDEPNSEGSAPAEAPLEERAALGLAERFGLRLGDQTDAMEGAVGELTSNEILALERAGVTVDDGPVRDTDHDGVLDHVDSDLDGDGYRNDVDLDVDDDGTPNTSDPDIDGDALPNAHDPDANGDGDADPIPA